MAHPAVRAAGLELPYGQIRFDISENRAMNLVSASSRLVLAHRELLRAPFLEVSDTEPSAAVADVATRRTGTSTYTALFS
jgi:hypothetical protein